MMFSRKSLLAFHLSIFIYTPIIIIKITKRDYCTYFVMVETFSREVVVVSGPLEVSQPTNVYSITTQFQQASYPTKGEQYKSVSHTGQIKKERSIRLIRTSDYLFTNDLFLIPY
jgi:hypothetical protein